MMKLFYFSAVLAILFFASCSKKNTPSPVTASKTGSVTINGGTYPTIIIGSQTWTALNFIGGTSSLTSPDATYGNYYTLAQADAITLPTGWRIPTRADYNNLLSNFTTNKNAAGDYSGDITVAEALADSSKFHSLGSPTNSSGFSAYPGGEYDIANKVFNDQVIAGAFLTSTTGTQNSVSVNYIFGIASDGVSIGLSNYGYFSGIDYNSYAYAYSLRFVKDN